MHLDQELAHAHARAHTHTYVGFCLSGLLGEADQCLIHSYP